MSNLSNVYKMIFSKNNCIVLIVVCFACFFSCKKEDQSTTKLLTTDTTGIFGRVALFDEYGDAVLSNDNVLVTFHCIDTIGYDTSSFGVKIPKIFTFSDSVKTDNNGYYALSVAPKGYYNISYQKNEFGSNGIYRFYHIKSKGDTLSLKKLSKVPLADIVLIKDSLSADNKLLYITRKVQLTGFQSRNYAVVTRYFFSNSKDVNSTNYKHEWISGATVGFGGYSDIVTVMKSIDKLFVDGISKSDSIYYCAYLDNSNYYDYLDNNIRIFPNLTKISNVKAFKLK